MLLKRNPYSYGFDRSVGMFMRKLSNVEIGVKLSLLESLCMSFYGIDLFTNNKNSCYPPRNLSVAYHYAIRGLLGLPMSFSKHYACSLLGRLKFRHFLHLRMLRFCIWVVNKNNPCIGRYRRYFVSSSHFYTFI